MVGLVVNRIVRLQMFYTFIIKRVIIINYDAYNTVLYNYILNGKTRVKNQSVKFSIQNIIHLYIFINIIYMHVYIYY